MARLGKARSGRAGSGQQRPDKAGLDLKEKHVLRQVTDFLTAKHIFHFRLNTGRFFADGRTFKSHSLGIGASDFLALPEASAPVWIECKSSEGTQRPSQKLFEEYVKAWGHKYLVVHSIDDLAGFL